MPAPALEASPALKTELMFEGVRYTPALGAAAEHALPNYYPYRFRDGEHDPTGTGKATIPYLMQTPDETMMRIMGNGDSPWFVDGEPESGYRLRHDDAREIDIRFEPRHAWLGAETSDGFPVARAGVSTHGDMLIVNVAPGCEYFLRKENGRSMRCTFCSYGAPDERTKHLGQVAGQVEIPDLTLSRLREAIAAVLAETEIRHIYLVGGSLTEPREEGRRFLALARAVREANPAGIPVCLGSGALPADMIDEFHRERLVDAVCFNLEVWSEALFARVCPGKNTYVGYDGWIGALEHAVRRFGTGRVYSAMVAGVELEPEHGMGWEDAARLAVEGADDLTARGIIPVYSLYWPTGGKERPDYQSRLRNFFETLAVEYRDIRLRRELRLWDGFMCHRCAYMQLECDMDRAAA
ncbi:MAG: hypothetical protein R3176_11115 [Woeseiaceae bacterium]|nr:hypothetical protein [Woeseiaceae bacterium]